MSSLLAIALRVAEEKTKVSPQAPTKTKVSPGAPPKRKTPETEEEKVHDPPENEAAEAKELVRQYWNELLKRSKAVADDFRKFAVKEYGPILKAKVGTPGKGKEDPNRVMLSKQEEISTRMKKLLSILDKVSSTRIQGNPAGIAAQIAAKWPNDKPNNWSTRAGLIAAVQNSMERTKAPEAIKSVLMKDPKNVKKNSKLIADFLKNSTDLKGTDVEDSGSVELAALAAAYRALVKNPVRVDAAALASEVDELTEQVYSEIQKLLAVPLFMKSWEKAVKSIGQHDEPEFIQADEYYGEVQKSLKNFFKKGEDPPFDPDAFVDGLESVVKDFDKAPKELKKVVQGYRSAATSNKTGEIKVMGLKTATYHGVQEKFSPEGPYATFRIDRRYFTKEHYDSIIAHAKEFLEEDWLKYDWEGGAKDARFRAALDMSIWMADKNLYQSKVDVETYNMLLATLMGQKDDTFSETFISTDDKVKRRASSMSNQHYQNILRIASELRLKDPRTALALVQNARKLVAQEEEQQEQGSPPPPPPPPPATGQSGGGGPVTGQQQQSQQECLSQEQQQGQQQQGQEGGKPSGAIDLKDLKPHVKQMSEAKDIDSFLEALEEIDGCLGDTAAGPTASSKLAAEVSDLAPLADMDDAQAAAFLEKMKKHAHDLFNENEIDKFMDGLESIFSESEAAAKGVKTAGVLVPLALLVRFAHSHPETRPLLLPIIVAAKKKKDKKKKPKKKGKKPNPFADKGKGGEKGGKKPPFGGKGAPPFGGKKAPPFGKGKGKKAAIAIDESDIKW